MKGKRFVICLVCALPMLSGCLGTAAGATVGAAVQVATVPFKVAGAFVGAVAHTAGAIVAENSEGGDD